MACNEGTVYEYTAYEGYTMYEYTVYEGTVYAPLKRWVQCTVLAAYNRAVDISAKRAGTRVTDVPSENIHAY